MRRLRTITAMGAGALVALAGTLAGAAPNAGARQAPTSHAGRARHAGSGHHNTSKNATVMIAKTKKGQILVSRAGSTLYLFAPDPRNRDTCVKHPHCTTVWPLYTTKGRPTAGKGIKGSLLGTIKVGNVEQVTYAGHPLYLWAGGTGADTSYIGANSDGGAWYGVSPSGKAIK